MKRNPLEIHWLLDVPFELYVGGFLFACFFVGVLMYAVKQIRIKPSIWHTPTALDLANEELVNRKRVSLG